MRQQRLIKFEFCQNPVTSRAILGTPVRMFPQRVGGLHPSNENHEKRDIDWLSIYWSETRQTRLTYEGLRTLDLCFVIDSSIG